MRGLWAPPWKCVHALWGNSALRHCQCRLRVARATLRFIEPGGFVESGGLLEFRGFVEHGGTVEFGAGSELGGGVVRRSRFESGTAVEGRSPVECRRPFGAGHARF